MAGGGGIAVQELTGEHTKSGHWRSISRQPRRSVSLDHRVWSPTPTRWSN